MTRYVGALLLMPLVASANCPFSRIDHEPSFDESGPWRPRNYRSLIDLLTVGQAGDALWEGSDSRLGRTLWQGMEAELLGGAASEAGKRIFTRSRPGQGTSCQWFQGGAHRSFPSGEATQAAALVTPYVLEFGHEHPSAYALAFIPAYIGVARLKNHAHWPSDVVAGWSLGAGVGWFAHRREVPLLVTWLPRGLTIGFRKSF